MKIDNLIHKIKKDIKKNGVQNTGFSWPKKYHTQINMIAIETDCKFYVIHSLALSLGLKSIKALQDKHLYIAKYVKEKSSLPLATSSSRLPPSIIDQIWDLRQEMEIKMNNSEIHYICLVLGLKKLKTLL